MIQADHQVGVNMTLERRQALVALARTYNLPILEDDPYGELRFEGEALPNLFELDPDLVIYASTFSKTLAPGFRLGWIIANQATNLRLDRKKKWNMLVVTTSVVSCGPQRLKSLLLCPA